MLLFYNFLIFRISSFLLTVTSSLIILLIYSNLILHMVYLHKHSFASFNISGSKWNYNFIEFGEIGKIKSSHIKYEIHASSNYPSDIKCKIF